MTKDFDVNDRTSWYFGSLGRDEADTKLNHGQTNGVFLIRECQSDKGSLVLCVREKKVNSTISHYVIKRLFEGGKYLYRLGPKKFPDIPTLLTFYKTHYLDTTPLTHPLPLQQLPAKALVVQTRINIYDTTQLALHKGDIVTVTKIDDNGSGKWYGECNGSSGMFPSRHVQFLDDI